MTEIAIVISNSSFNCCFHQYLNDFKDITTHVTINSDALHYLPLQVKLMHTSQNVEEQVDSLAQNLKDQRINYLTKKVCNRQRKCHAKDVNSAKSLAESIAYLASSYLLKRAKLLFPSGESLEEIAEKELEYAVLLNTE
ncbi:hypothetical protein ACTFIU_011290 [Dictyostelium citrinum]